MLTLLFWNVGQKSLHARVARIVQARDVDIVLLAECPNPGWVTRALNRLPGGPHYFPVTSQSRVSIFTRIAPARFREVRGTSYFSIRELAGITGLRESLVVAAAHLPSKREVGERSQVFDAVHLSQAITTTEDALGHTRTVLLGDLNMNPFDPGVVAGTGLHGVMTRDIARRGTRTVREREYRFFYNPMWRFFGDGTPGPAGTHFYWKADEECLFWNIFDQVLVRPSLLDRLSGDGAEVLDSDGVETLLGSNGRPDTDRGSDHLPVLLRLDM